MRAFADLYDAIDSTTSTNLKVTAMRAYFATAQPTKAVAVYQRLFQDNPRDIALASQIGQLLTTREELGSRTLELACWQRVEKSFKQGTPDWLGARAKVIAAYCRCGHKDQARKLLA